MAAAAEGGCYSPGRYWDEALFFSDTEDVTPALDSNSDQLNFETFPDNETFAEPPTPAGFYLHDNGEEIQTLDISTGSRSSHLSSTKRIYEHGTVKVGSPTQDVEKGILSETLEASMPLPNHFFTRSFNVSSRGDEIIRNDSFVRSSVLSRSGTSDVGDHTAYPPIARSSTPVRRLGSNPSSSKLSQLLGTYSDSEEGDGDIAAPTRKGHIGEGKGEGTTQDIILQQPRAPLRQTSTSLNLSIDQLLVRSTPEQEQRPSNSTYDRSAPPQNAEMSYRQSSSLATSASRTSSDSRAPPNGHKRPLSPVAPLPSKRRKPTGPFDIDSDDSDDSAAAPPMGRRINMDRIKQQIANNPNVATETRNARLSVLAKPETSIKKPTDIQLRQQPDGQKKRHNTPEARQTTQPRNSNVPRTEARNFAPLGSVAKAAKNSGGPGPVARRQVQAQIPVNKPTSSQATRKPTPKTQKAAPQIPNARHAPTDASIASTRAQGQGQVQTRVPVSRPNAAGIAASSTTQTPKSPKTVPQTESNKRASGLAIGATLGSSQIKAQISAKQPTSRPTTAIPATPIPKNGSHTDTVKGSMRPNHVIELQDQHLTPGEVPASNLVTTSPATASQKSASRSENVRRSMGVVEVSKKVKDVAPITSSQVPARKTPNRPSTATHLAGNQSTAPQVAQIKKSTRVENINDSQSTAQKTVTAKLPSLGATATGGRQVASQVENAQQTNLSSTLSSTLEPANALATAAHATSKRHSPVSKQGAKKIELPANLELNETEKIQSGVSRTNSSPTTALTTTPVNTPAGPKSQSGSPGPKAGATTAKSGPEVISTSSQSADVPTGLKPNNGKIPAGSPSKSTETVGKPFVPAETTDISAEKSTVTSKPTPTIAKIAIVEGKSAIPKKKTTTGETAVTVVKETSQIANNAVATTSTALLTAHDTQTLPTQARINLNSRPTTPKAPQVPPRATSNPQQGKVPTQSASEVTKEARASIQKADPVTQKDKAAIQKALTVEKPAQSAQKADPVIQRVSTSKEFAPAPVPAISNTQANTLRSKTSSVPPKEATVPPDVNFVTAKEIPTLTKDRGALTTLKELPVSLKKSPTATKKVLPNPKEPFPKFKTTPPITKDVEIARPVSPVPLDFSTIQEEVNLALSTATTTSTPASRPESPFFEYTVFQSTYPLSAFPSTSAHKVEISTFTDIDIANAKAESLYLSASRRHHLIYDIQFSEWSNKKNDAGCMTYLGTFSPTEYPGRQSQMKIWVERHAASVHTKRELVGNPWLVGKFVFMLQLNRIQEYQPNDEEKDEDKDAMDVDDEEKEDEGEQDEGEQDEDEGEKDEDEEPTKVYTLLPKGYAEVYTIADLANRAARRLQIEMSHRTEQMGETDKNWKFTQLLQAQSAKQLMEKVEALKKESNDGESEGCWESEFKEKGADGDKYEIVVRKVWLSGPRNI